jgi:hypothetical protein
MQFESLIGKTVTQVRFSKDKDLIVFETVGEDSLPYNFGFQAEGDCCSSSWFEHINGLSALIGQKVNNVVERNLPDPPESKNYECLQLYGWTLETSLGRFDIEMRNESNGYYGGYITECVTGKNLPPVLNEDF